MAWWPSSDSRIRKNSESHLDPKYGHAVDTECCYSECLNCGAGLYVIIRFNKCIPKVILGLGIENNWPQKYFK